MKRLSRISYLNGVWFLRDIPTIFLTCALCSACGWLGGPDEKKDLSQVEQSEVRQKDEKAGQIYLKEAREALQQEKFIQAKQKITELRQQHPMAINARKEGILLLDSIELMHAAYQLRLVDAQLRDENEPSDSLKAEFEDLFNKVKFYRRKLEHDKKYPDGKPSNETNFS